MDGESKVCVSLGNIYYLLGNIWESINYYEKLVVCFKYKLGKFKNMWGLCEKILCNIYVNYVVLYIVELYLVLIGCWE